MSRPTVNISIRVLPGGAIRAVKNPIGNIPVYEDQIPQINEIMKKARTIQDAHDLLYSSGIKYDRHHADPNVPTPRDLEASNMRKMRSFRPSRSEQPPPSVPIPSFEEEQSTRGRKTRMGRASQSPADDMMTPTPTPTNTNMGQTRQQSQQYEMQPQQIVSVQSQGNSGNISFMPTMPNHAVQQQQQQMREEAPKSRGAVQGSPKSSH